MTSNGERVQKGRHGHGSVPANRGLRMTPPGDIPDRGGIPERKSAVQRLLEQGETVIRGDRDHDSSNAIAIPPLAFPRFNAGVAVSGASGICGRLQSERPFRDTPHPNRSLNEFPGRPEHLVIITSTVGWGGTEVLVWRTAQRATARGHRVTIVQVGHDVYGARGLLGGSVESVRIASALWSPSIRTWYRLLRGLEPDVVVLFKGGIDNRAMALDLACLALRVRYVTVEAHLPPLLRPLAHRATVRGWLGVRMRYAKKRVVFWLHSRAPTRIIANSAVVRDRLENYYGFRSGISVTPIGIDAGVFAPSPSQHLVQREAWGIDTNDVVVGAVGRLDYVKRLDWAVRALAAHVSSGNRPPAWLVLGGEGSERVALQELALLLGVADRVRFLGWVPSTPEVIASLDIFVLPSEAEGFGITLIESMATGCVCVATDSGGPREILTDPSLGLLVPRDDERAFEEAVRRAIAMSPAERAKMGNNARASMIARFDETRLSDQLLNEILG